MPVYEYQAYNASGKVIKGVIEADSPKGARLKLRQKNILPTALVESTAKEKASGWNKQIQFGGNKISTSQLSISTRQLATLIGAGMPVVESLRALCEQLESTSLKRIFNDIGDKVNEGTSLANALKQHPKAFPRLYVNMVGSGEASGTLDMVLERLADLLEASAMLKRKVMSALTYPILMLVLCFVVVVLLLAYVVPQITAIFQDQKMVLPLPTQIVIALSDFTKQYWYLIFGGLVLAFYSFRAYARTQVGRKRLHTILLKLPLVGSLSLKAATARFSRNLGTMLSSGIEILQALAIAKNVVGNVVVEEAIEKAAEGVREGKSLAAELKKSGLFPPLVIHMSAVGEQTGALDKMLIRAAKNYESEIDAFITGLSSILEPILIIFLAIIVGVILASVMLPMLEMSSIGG